MNAQPLTVLCPGDTAPERYARTLEFALRGRRARILTELRAQEPLRGQRLLFAVPLPEDGVNPELSRLLGVLRRNPGLLEGCTGGVLVDGQGDLYTKSAARELAERIVSFTPVKSPRPRLTVLHASSRNTSNTMALWEMAARRLESRCEITEIGLRNGTLEDCAGCPYTTCLHFGEAGGCFYGGVMVQEVYPAIRACNAVVLLCPNYNDALSANLTAAVNRLTALYRTTPFTGKAVYALAVSGYSGGDIVASQAVSAMSMNKGFYLPPRFVLLETANDAGEAAALPGIRERMDAFAGRILSQLCGS